MSNFLIISIIGSIVLTVAVNLLPALFPNAAAKAERKILESVQKTHDESVQKTHDDRANPNTPKVRVFFPWKAMLLISVVLTVAVNLVEFMAR